MANGTAQMLERRQKKTRKMIQDALLELINKKPVEKITISELSELADINRKTFYNHYESIMDVKRDMDRQYADKLLHLFVPDNDDNGFKEYGMLTDRIVDAISTEPKKARLLFESGEIQYLSKEFKKLVKPYISDFALKNNLSSITLSCMLEFVTNGIISVLGSWLKGEIPANADEIKETLKYILRSYVVSEDFPFEELQEVLPEVRDEIIEEKIDNM